MEADGEVSANHSRCDLFSVVASSVSVLTCVFVVTIAMTLAHRVPLKNVRKLLGVKSTFKPTCLGVLGGLRF